MKKSPQKLTRKKTLNYLDLLHCFQRCYRDFFLAIYFPIIVLMLPLFAYFNRLFPNQAVPFDFSVDG
jgi:hypothetical protein